MVTLKASTSRNWLTDDNVFLQALKRINLALDCSIGQNLSGFLEGCSRQERIGCQRCLSNTKEQWLTNWWVLAFENQIVCNCLELEAVNLASWQIVRIAWIDNSNLAQHLTSNNFDVLVVNVYTLGYVNVLYLVNDVTKRSVWIGQTQQVVWVYRTLGQLLANLYFATIGNTWEHLSTSRNGVLADVTFLVMDGQGLAVLVTNNLQRTSNFSQHSLALRLTSFKKLGNTRQTVSNVFTCNTARVERTHRQLRTRLTNGLSSNNTSSSANVYRTRSCQVPTVALLANAVFSMTSHNCAMLNLANACVIKRLELSNGGRIFASLHDDLARFFAYCRLSQATTYQGIVDFALSVKQWALDTIGSAAVELANNNVLSNVNQTTSKVTRVSRTKCGVSQTLTSTVS